MNVYCKMQEVRDHLVDPDNTGFYEFCNVTDSTGALEHIHLFKVNYDSNLTFPFCVISPGRHESVFQSNCHINFRTEVVVDFIDSYDFYIDENGEKYSEAVALSIFTEKIDEILKSSKKLFFRNITGFAIDVPPEIDDSRVEEQPYGRLITCTISYSFEPGGN